MHFQACFFVPFCAFCQAWEHGNKGNEPSSQAWKQCNLCGHLPLWWWLPFLQKENGLNFSCCICKFFTKHNLHQSLFPKFIIFMVVYEACLRNLWGAIPNVKFLSRGRVGPKAILCFWAKVIRGVTWATCFILMFFIKGMPSIYVFPHF